MSPETAAPPAERLSIAHLLVWTALSAALLGVDRATSQLPHLEISPLGQAIAFLYAPLFGAGVAALVLMAWRVTNGGPRFPSQPGHWLLVISGVQSLLHLSIGVIVATAQLGFSWELIILGRLVEELTCGTLFILAIRDSRRIWRAAFVVGLVGYGLGLLLTLVMQFWFIDPELLYGEFLLHWVVLTACALAVMDDCATSNQRDYLHWTGIDVRLAYLSLATSIPYLLRWLEVAEG